MPVVYGNISGSVRSIVFTVPTTIKWFAVQDKNGGGATVNLGIVVSGTVIFFKTITITTDQSSDELVDIKMLAGSQIIIVSNSDIYYYFSIE